MRLRKKHLPHRVTIERLGGEGAEGAIYAPPATGRPAYVEQKSRLVVDRRAASETAGQEITSTTFVVLLPGDDALPGSWITTHAGTPRQRRSQVIDSAAFDYRGTPNHIELYLE
ncbi:hypothetical protein IT072_03655 [Leifsonia sp. ZF2019]|uniref:hypothetical protein n=1 Tax=Leifsonia sp. ZF2019 TaxID=2781978 RepID=UPI001CBBF26A|nr:hypothetical protein [Leifsonia sp. ZF2019]UAJ80154.1 hypothetical protein IT072_03655 [Leifsonia sp. ZF2019]